MAAAFGAQVLDRIREAGEVRIETSADGHVHRTIIWIVVDGDDVYVRSVRGPRGRWYRELTRSGTGAILVGEDRIAVRALTAADPASIERCNAALRAKYRGDPAVRSMLRDDTLPTTLRLEPA